MAYAVTFGAYGITHHRIFFLLRGVDHKYLLLNILCLMAVAIFPSPTLCSPST